MCNYCQQGNKKGFWSKWKESVWMPQLNYFFFPVKCLAKFGTVMTQRSKVVSGALLCLKDERQIRENLF